MTPGRLLYLLYYLPLGEVARSWREGGPWEQWIDRRARLQMEQAAQRLPPVNFHSTTPLEIHQLTGRRYIFQSIFCVWSLAHAAQRNVAPTFYDDGTLPPRQAEWLKNIFPQARIVCHAEACQRVETYLPASRFPALRERFLHYPHIRKLINVHLGSRGWKLALDADCLFFRRPDFLLDWLARPIRPLYLPDVAEAYGYPSSILVELAGASPPAKLNSGLFGYQSESLDWEKLEFWCASFLRRHGSHYLLEQTLTAMLVAGKDCAIAPSADYITLPSEQEARSPQAVMHHYVAEAKRWCYRSAWKRAAALSQQFCD